MNIPYTFPPIPNAFALKNIHTKKYFGGFISASIPIASTDDISKALCYHTAQGMKLCRHRFFLDCNLNKLDWEVIEVKRKLVNVGENGSYHAVVIGEV